MEISNRANRLKKAQRKLCLLTPYYKNKIIIERRKLIMLTVQKEKEILYFAKNKVKELRSLLESKEVQKQYKINPDCLEWDEHKVNIDNYTMRYREISSDIITIPIKDSVKNLHKIKMAVEEISREHRCSLYVQDAYEWDGEVDTDCFLRLSSPSINRNLQVLRLMAYQESEKINSLMFKVNNAKEKSLLAHFQNIQELLRLGVDVLVNLSYKKENVVGRVKRMDGEDIELLVQCQPELVTISTIQLKDPWIINSVEGETPVNWMFSNRSKKNTLTKEMDKFMDSVGW